MDPRAYEALEQGRTFFVFLMGMAAGVALIGLIYFARWVLMHLQWV